MKRNLTILYRALIAVLALSAFATALNARAAAPEFHMTSSAAGGGTAKGASNDNVITVQGGAIKCVENGGVKGARFESTLPKTGTSTTVSASYGNAGKGCTAFGVAAVVNMKSCDYVFNLVAGSNPATAKVDLKCNTAGDSVTVIASGLPCTTTIGSQTGLSHIVFENSGGGEPTSISAQVTLDGIKYTNTGAGCVKIGTFTDGKYVGTFPYEGFEGATKVGFHVF